MASHANLSAAADDRKARLAQLRSLKRKQTEDEPPASTTPSAPAVSGSLETGTSEKPVPSTDLAATILSGRNYDAAVRGPKLGFENDPTAGVHTTLEGQAADVEEETRRKAAIDAQDRAIDLFKIQPKRPNWDLRRELDKKLEVLNVRTDNAIARLVRERLEAKRAASDAAGADGSAGALEGAEMVEGIRLREREEEEEERRERELDDA